MSGPKYDLNSHAHRHSMPAIAVTIEVICSVLLWIRIGNRFATRSRLGIDDYFIVVAWVLGVLVTAAVLLGTEKYGFDRHIWDVPSSEWWKGGLIGFFVEVFFFWSTCFTKISVLMFYRRLVAGTLSRNFKFAIWAAIAFVVAYTIAFFVVILLTCTPIEAIWRQYDAAWAAKHPHFECTSVATQTEIAKLVGALSVVTDFYTVMLPALLVVQIRISKRQRWGLFFIFSIGLLVVGAGIARTIFLGRIFAEVFDKSWYGWDVYLASIIECNVAIICACAPSLRALFGKFFKDVSTRYGSKSSSNRRRYPPGKSSFGSSITGLSTDTGTRRPSKSKANVEVEIRALSEPSSPEVQTSFSRDAREQNSLQQNPTYSRNYAETISVGYEDSGVLPDVRSPTPIRASQLWTKTLRPQIETHGPILESRFPPPSPFDSSNDVSLVLKQESRSQDAVKTNTQGQVAIQQTYPQRATHPILAQSQETTSRMASQPSSLYSEPSSRHDPLMPLPLDPRRIQTSKENWERTRCLAI